MNFVFHQPDGTIMQWSRTTNLEAATTLASMMGTAVIESEIEPSALDWVEGGELVSPPETPSINHVWNRTLRIWEFPLQTVFEAATKRITTELTRRKNAIISYDGCNLDADVRSQTNIANKITELDQSILLGIETPVETLIWRDADNISHSFSSAQELKDWLGGLAVAIAQRGTLAYVWSWEQKALLAKLVEDNNGEAILSFPDTTT